MNKILKPTNDLIFKLIFGDNKNTDILTSFLQSVLDLPKSEYNHLTIVDPHTRLEKQDDKTAILDVKLHTKSGNIIDIEIQIADIPLMRNRIVYYTSKMITEQLNKGDTYNLKKVISILITDYKIITENNVYHNKYQLYDKNTGSLFTDIFEVNVLELPKLPSETDNTELWNWLKFLKADREEDFTMLAQKNIQIDKAVGVLKELSEDERTRLLYEAREKASRDHKARMEGAYERGIEQGIERGIEQGIERGIIKVAINLLKKDTPIEDIIDLTGLTEEEIKDIIEKNS